MGRVWGARRATGARSDCLYEEGPAINGQGHLAIDPGAPCQGPSGC